MIKPKRRRRHPIQVILDDQKKKVDRFYKTFLADWTRGCSKALAKV